MSTFTFNTQSTKASWILTIYIRANGSVDPSTAPISNLGNVYYTFEANINGKIEIERNNIVVDGNGYTLHGNGDYCGFYLKGKSNVTIKNTNIKTFNYGIYIHWSSKNNIIIHDNIIENNKGGIYLGWSSDKNTITQNNITQNKMGVSLSQSSFNKITLNNIDQNDGCGIWLESSFNNMITQNNLTNNGDGIGFGDSKGNSITQNYIAQSEEYGIFLRLSQKNTFYHNNFIDKANTVYIEGIRPYIDNTWDDGYPSGGNYWSYFSDVDEFSGTNQNQPRSDGIRDKPRIIDKDNQDGYPLMNPWSPPSPPPECRRDILPGYLLLCSSPHSPVLAVSEWTHAGVYIGEREGYAGEWVVEARPSGVDCYPITDWDYPNKVAVEILRVQSGYGEAEDEEIRKRAVEFAKWQVGKPYSWLHKRHYDNESESWYCTELAWAAYLNQGVNIDGQTDSWGWITPDEIHDDDNTYFVNGHFERKPAELRSKFIHEAFIASIHSPADIVVTSPDGLAISNEAPETSWGLYILYDIDKNGDLDATVSIPERKLGTYQISVMAKPAAEPTDTYILEVSAGDTTIILAENVPISDIPSQSYVLESTENGIVHVPAMEAPIWVVGAVVITMAVATAVAVVFWRKRKQPSTKDEQN